jgi:hypothetical protein
MSTSSVADLPLEAENVFACLMDLEARDFCTFHLQIVHIDRLLLGNKVGRTGSVSIRCRNGVGMDFPTFFSTSQTQK